MKDISLDPTNEAKTYARIARCYLKQDRLAEARAILAEEAARMRESGGRGYFARGVRTSNAEACLLGLGDLAGDYFLIPLRGVFCQLR